MSWSDAGPIIVEMVRARGRFTDGEKWEVRRIRACTDSEGPSTLSHQDWAEELLSCCGPAYFRANGEDDPLLKVRRSCRRVWLVGHIESWTSGFYGGGEDHEDAFEVDRVITLEDIR